MKTPLYALTFVIAFIAVTGILIVSNDHYNNIFKFDFRPRAVVDSAMAKEKKLAKAKADSLAHKGDSLHVAQSDSLSKADSSTASGYTAPVPDIDLRANTATTTSGTTNSQMSQNIKKLVKADSSYFKWKKATIKLYESMDSKKLAKIILSLTDNEARELIYSMKKKKAAEILSYLNPDDIKRLTRLQ